MLVGAGALDSTVTLEFVKSGAFTLALSTATSRGSVSAPIMPVCSLPLGLSMNAMRLILAPFTLYGPQKIMCPR
jgi:hypothetical protein